MGFRILSNTSAVMKKIYDAHWESGNETHSKMGWEIKKSLSDTLRSKKTEYTIISVGGKRKIIKSGLHSMGQRFDTKTGMKLKSDMSNFIQWDTYPSTGTTVVGGIFKGRNTAERKNGKVVGMRYVPSVSPKAIAILNKINDGELGQALWRDPKSGRLSPTSMKGFEEAHERNNGTGFIAEGNRKALSGIDTRIRQGMKMALKNRENINADMRRTA